MGGASPYRARFIGLPPCGQGAGSSEEVPCENGEKYFGFVNVANTCYVNSVLQALYFCTRFRRAAIRTLSDHKDDSSDEESLLTSLAQLFAQIEGQKRAVGCLTPRRFLTKLRKANDLFCTSEHQDAHEFMQFLLNDIAEHAVKRLQKSKEADAEKLKGAPQGANKIKTAAALLSNNAQEEEPEEEVRTWIHEIFQGYLVNQMKCLCCESVSVRRETFLDLSVDIERHTSIAACLRAFESTELLRAGNKFFCDHCGCLQEAEKRLRIYQLPSVLTLHLKRFKYDDRIGRCRRLPYRVVFPLQLRVVEHRPPRRHSPHEAGTANGHCRKDGGSNTADVTGATSTDGEEPTGHAQPPSRLFELKSVVVHIGRESNRGHYVTVVRNGDRCVLLDDDEVRAVEPEVLRSFYGIANPQTQGSRRPNTGNNNSRSHGQQSGGNNGWGSSENGLGNSRSADANRERLGNQSTTGPLYERAPEGTCCGYLLFYEAVDSAPDHDSGSVIDVGSAAEWISEERFLSDSDNDEEDTEEPAQSGSQERSHPYACDDGELTQAFEQRCIPRGTRAPAAGTAPGDAKKGGTGNGLAWADSDGAAGANGARTLGSVVPAAGAAEGAPSRPNTVNGQSPRTSGQGAGGVEASG
jgi:ubiquitin carboxyl-terminal hydrolase 12/46